jgi:hypothetical protein
MKASGDHKAEESEEIIATDADTEADEIVEETIEEEAD